MRNLEMLFTIIGALLVFYLAFKVTVKGVSEKKWYITCGGFLLLAFVVFFGVSYIYENKDRNLEDGWAFNEEENEVEARWDNRVLSVDNLYEELLSQGLDFPEIVLAQALLETDHFRSYSCRERHNLFGLRNRNGYMEFPHWSYSVAAYKRYIQKYEDTPNDYYHYLNKLGYAEDSVYTDKVKSMVQKTKISK